MQNGKVAPVTAGDLLKNLTTEEADAYGLVLSSSRIAYEVKKGEQGWDICVDAAKHNEAKEAIRAYLEENLDAHATSGTWYTEYGRTFSGIWVCLGLVAFHVFIVLSHDRHALVETYGSSARHLLDGEFYRAVTSLMIHANALHLVTNVCAIGLFGTAVCQIMGPGVGWLMILLSGAAGNFVNGLLYESDHLSIGSSTAVFGAVGILAGYQFSRRLGHKGRGKKAWVPLGAGLALLAFLGGSRHSDLTAHLFGFLAGILLGVLYGLTAKQVVGELYQRCLLLVALMLVVMSWTIGIRA
jgi:membrane associated rhomboid family serine protease